MFFQSKQQTKFAKHTPVIKVIGVTNIKSDKVVRVVDTISYVNGLERTVGPTLEGEPYTIVLYTEDGVLNTKRFPGTWTIAQCKEWNPSSWLAN